MTKRKPNPAAAASKLALDGHDLVIVYDFAALHMMQELTGVNLLDAWDASKFGAKEVACFLFAGVNRHQPDLDLDWCFRVLSLDNFNEVFTFLLKSLRKNLPDPVKANPPQPVVETK